MAIVRRTQKKSLRSPAGKKKAAPYYNGNGNGAESIADVEIEKIDSEESDTASAPVSYDILAYPADFTLEVLYDKWKRGEIKIPRLQRRYVWTHSQASKLIESFLLGLPVPPIFLYMRRGESLHTVVDGLQR